MRIAVFGIRGLPPGYGGFEMTADNVLSRLAERGHKITVYNRGMRKGGPSTYKGMSMRYLPSLEYKYLSTPSHSTIAALDIAMRQYDALFAFNVGIAAQVALLRLLGKRTVFFIDGLFWRHDKYGPFSRAVLAFSEKLAREFASSIVCDSLTAKEHYAIALNTEIECIPSGADVVTEVVNTGILTKLCIEPKKYVLSVGRLLPDKRQHFVIEAFKKIDTNMKLVIVGGNPYDRAYVHKIKNLCASDNRIIFAGPIYGYEVNELFFHSAVFVSASRIEGTSLSLLQAMGCGNAVLVSDIPENHAATYGKVMEFITDDFVDLTEKMQLLLNDESLRNTLSKNALQIIRDNYSWDTVADKFENLLLKAAM